MSVAALAAEIRSGRRKASEVAEERLADIAARDSLYNSFTEVTAARARAEAAAVDAKVAAGIDPGPLAGVPVAVKNLFDLEGVVTLAGSKIERDSPPAARDGFLVRRLSAAGAVMLGALNMDEYAYGFSTENEHAGPSRNPHDTSRITGGSSGGSTAAVAAGLVPITLGSDTNGSIRVPASLCGIWGLKPTYGRLSRHGSFPFVGAFDHLGPFARELADLALAYNVMQGEDPEDPAQSFPGIQPATLVAEIGGLRIAVADGHFARGGHPEAFAAVAAVARALGATRSVTIPHAAEARAAAFLITMAEGANLHMPNLRSRPQDFDIATRDRFLAGALLPAHWIQQAQRLRALYRAEVLKLFNDVDVIIAPATPYVAPKIGQAMIEVEGESIPVRPNLGVYTQPISCIGLPVIAAPLADPVALGTPGGLPIGVQLIGAPWAEATLFRVAAALERMGVCATPALRKP